jgi:transcription-repair coupling factor (superfamily II helicase)
MSLNGVLELVKKHPEFRRHLAQVEATDAPATIALRAGTKSAYLAALWKERQLPMLVLTPRPEESRRIHDQLVTYLGEGEPVYLLPEPEVLPFERLAVDARTSNQRLAALAALARSPRLGRPAEDGAKPSLPPLPPLVIASIGAALRRTLPPQVVAGSTLVEEEFPILRVGGRIGRVDDLLARWVKLGYRHEPLVETPGTFSQRGGIIDVYPPHTEHPLRVELWDDEVDTIRWFDPYTQRSIGPAEAVDIIPAREQLPGLLERPEIDRRIGELDYTGCSQALRDRVEDELVTLFSNPDLELLHFYNGLLNQSSLLDYLPYPGILVLDRPGQIEDEAQEQEEKYARMRFSREERSELPGNFPSPYLPWQDFAAQLRARAPDQILLQSHLQAEFKVGLKDGEAPAIESDPIFQPATQYYGQLEQFSSDVRRHQRQGDAVVVVSQHAQGRLTEILEQSEVGVASSDGIARGEPPESGRVYMVAGGLREGWTVAGIPDAAGKVGSASLILLTDAELFGTVKERGHRPQRSQKELGREVVLSELVPGSYVVHVDHGVARFTGTTQMSENGEDKEYLVLEYADNDKLYVPTDHLDRVGAYLGSLDHQPPNLTRLGTAEWARIKERVKGATKELAQELLQLYAARELAQGHEFSADTAWQRELEDSFPFLETPDQTQAINDTKADMEQAKPMDRLICGDVGYGKTEVALRAAFKTVSEGMQVGMLVPTTVLAQQHYATFSERLAAFPISVEVLSRFRTPQEQKEVVSGLEHGNVDIVIGTHRLLQKDVSFKNLGLVVVDEEQRFGVGHKERLKQLRREVDVLTLSATPIPRTLHMALSGIRDMSVMHTPPEARLPVKTFVSEYSEDIIREAILRELERDGQVFFLHNRVKTIGQTAADLAELVPQARFLIGHGQMPEAELEEVMVAFGKGEADVLVCTTIIESGLDMPNVNTLILDRADRFGLSQLYQLRGRVGRGEHRAYAYLMVPRGRRITSAAEQRIEAILEASDLGSGFRIAMRDMEIRGAGNLLGAAQSGQIYAVGMELYGQLLQEAVKELMAEQGQQSEPASASAPELPRVDLPLLASIPEDYVEHMPTRMALYQKLAKVKNRDQVSEIREEMQDRFGTPPERVENLLKLMDLRALAAQVGANSVVHANNAITLNFRDPIASARTPLQRALGPSAKVGNQQLQVPLRGLGEQWLSRFTLILERLKVFQERLNSLAG